MEPLWPSIVPENASDGQPMVDMYTQTDETVETLGVELAGVGSVVESPPPTVVAALQQQNLVRVFLRVRPHLLECPSSSSLVAPDPSILHTPNNSANIIRILPHAPATKTTEAKEYICIYIPPTQQLNLRGNIQQYPHNRSQLEIPSFCWFSQSPFPIHSEVFFYRIRHGGRRGEGVEPQGVINHVSNSRAIRRGTFHSSPAWWHFLSLTLPSKRSKPSKTYHLASMYAEATKTLRSSELYKELTEECG